MEYRNSMLAAILAAAYGVSFNDEFEDYGSNSKPKEISGKLPVPPKPNGLKYFPEYGVWAINEKNAIRKHNIAKRKEG